MVLSKEQLAQIQKQLEGLSPEEQQKRMNEILAQLPPEELEELRKQQCPFCMIAAGKIAAKIIYEDDRLIGALDINPANKGHIILFPKEHVMDSYSLSDYDAGHIFKVANKLAKILVDVFGAKGTNILVANGSIAGQNVAHIIVHVIPRFENDKVRFAWESLKFSEKELNEICEKIKGKGITFEEKKVEAVKTVEEEHKEEERIP